MIELTEVSIEYQRHGRFRRSRQSVCALDRVSIRIEAGARIGITGPSGSGKSTLARCIAGWLTPAAGVVRRNGQVQLVMQDPGASLNPRFTAARAVVEPLRIRGIRSGNAAELLEQVGIEAARAGDRTGQFSGGQRARIALARALAALPEPVNSLLILDESLSSLDEDTRSSVLDLLDARNRTLGLAFLIVDHDPELLAEWTDQVLIMESGRVVV